MEIKWQENHSVGVLEIDLQHKEWINITNRLDRVVLSSKHKELINAIADLGGYADMHFTTEEKYFDQFNYQGAEVHKMAHQVYRNKVDEFLTGIKEQRSELGEEMVKFAQGWLLSHIETLDQQYAQFFQEHGLS